MSGISWWFGYGLVLSWMICHARATLTINQIVGPDSIRFTSSDELVLDCDFDATGEEEVVLKWFFNSLNEPIYQWIVQDNRAYTMGVLKDEIDPTYAVSDDPNSKFRALKFKEIRPELSGNYICKVDSDSDVKWLNKQLIVYSPPASFDIILINGDDQYQGDVLCDATNVFPKPRFDIFLAGENGTEPLPEGFQLTREAPVDENGFFNVSIRLSFNTSYLDVGTNTFVCELSIPGTNYTESKSVELNTPGGVARSGISFLLVIHLLALSLLLAT